MSTVTVPRRQAMAKRKPGKPELISVKLEADVIESARIVSAYTGETMAEMLSAILRPILAKRAREEAAKWAKSQGDAK